MPLSNSKNGVVRTGTALSQMIDETQSGSLYLKCAQESTGMSLFSNSCKELIDQLQKKLSLMSLESDIQIQSEKIGIHSGQELHRSQKPMRVGMLVKLNLMSTQAEEAVKTLKANYPEGKFREHLDEVIPEVKKVQISYQSYLKLLTDGRI